MADIICPECDGEGCYVCNAGVVKAPVAGGKRAGGRSSRSKGRRGETAALALLADRDYSCEDMSSGRASCDILAIDTHGTVWSVEAKNRDLINVREFRDQAKRNAKPRTRWMVLAHINGTSSWLCLRQGERPEVWHEKP